MDGRLPLKRILLFTTIYLLGLFTPLILTALMNPLGMLFVIGGASHEEIGRFTSPDKVVDAVLVQINPGAFSSYLYDLYIVPKGAKPSGAPVLNAKRFRGEQIRWEEPHLLQVQYDEARILHFGNLWYSKEVRGGQYYVDIELIPTSAVSRLKVRGQN
jgi:hypothetical protein